ncbi:MAG: carbohydrate kinase family protein [Phycisphaerae bacterium]|jgi:sugar/nucleoside kinase (ribokinase family)
MLRPYDVMAAGHLCIDIIPKFLVTGIKNIAEIMRPGKLVNVLDAAISTGGPVSNTGINMKTLGNKVCFCAGVGDDILGQITIDMLRTNGNADGIRFVKGVSSSYTVVVAPPNIDRIFLHNPGTNNYFGPENLNSELIKQCRHFHFGYPPLMSRMFANDGEELKEVFKIAKGAGATTSCDMTLPDPASPSGMVNWRKILENILPYIDIHLPSIEESFYMLHPEEFLRMKSEHNNAELIDFITPLQYSKIADELLAMGSKIVALKSGHRGVYIKTASKDVLSRIDNTLPVDVNNWSNRELWVPAFVVDMFGSATGSGDSTIAGFLSAFLKGLNIEISLKYATCCGLQNVRVLDATSGIKTWEETTNMIKHNMPMINTHIDSDDWKYSKEYALWAGTKDRLKQ